MIMIYLKVTGKKILLPLISSKANLEEGVAHIIDLGNQVNGHDNLTCVLVRIKVQPNLDGQSGLFNLSLV